MSQFDPLWLGAREDGPKPTFRDDSPVGATAQDGTLVPWPEQAVMAIEFTEERFPTYAMSRSRLIGVQFYGNDGWPLDFPEARKASLSQQVRMDFQVEPIDWRRLSSTSWRRAASDPLFLTRGRFESGLARGIVANTPPEEDDKK